MALLRLNLNSHTSSTSTGIPFPKTHPAVKPEHLNASNGKFFSDAEILEAEEHFAKNKGLVLKKFSHSCQAELRIFNIDGWLFAQYSGKKNQSLLGKGCFGSVRICQDLITGELLAIKKEKIGFLYEKKSTEYFQKNELLALEELNLLRGTFREYKKSKPYLYTITPLIYGVSLNTFLFRQASKLTPSRYLLIMKQLCKSAAELQSVHKMVHGDLKNDNIMFDYSYNASLIDFQTSLKIGNEHLFLVNAMGYRALEAFSRRCAPYPYTPATDMNSLGIICAELINATYESDYTYKQHKSARWYRVKQRETSSSNKKIPDDALCDKLITYFTQMTNPNPKSRPNISDAVDFFQSQYEATHDEGKIFKVGIIDLDEFRNIFNALENHKEHLRLSKNMDLLKQDRDLHLKKAHNLYDQLKVATVKLRTTLHKMDTLYFVDKAKSPDIHYQYIAQFLQQNSIPISDKLFTPNYLVSTTAGVIRSITQEHTWTNTDFHPAYFYVTKKKMPYELKKSLEDNSICTVSLKTNEKKITATITNHTEKCLASLTKPSERLTITA